MKELGKENGAKLNDRNGVGRIIKSYKRSIANLSQFQVWHFFLGYETTEDFVGQVDIPEGCPMLQLFMADNWHLRWNEKTSIGSISRTYYFLKGRDNRGAASRSVLHGEIDRQPL